MVSPSAEQPSSPTPDDTTTQPLATQERQMWSGALILTLLALGLLSFNTYRISDLAISDILFVVATVIVWGYIVVGKTSILSLGATRRTPPLILVGVILLLFGGVISSLWSLDPIASMIRVARLAWITVLWFWLMRTIISRYDVLLLAIAIFNVTMSIAAGIAIIDYLGITNLSNPPKVITGRESAFFTHPNMLGGALAVALPLIIVNLLRTSDADHHIDTRRRALTIAQIVIVVVGIGATGSMTAMAGALTGTLTLGFLHLRARSPRRRRRMTPLVPMMFAGLLATAVVVLSSSDLPVVQRISGFLSGESSGVERSVESRPQQNLYVLDQIDSFLIIGVGHDPTSSAEAWDADEDTLGRGVHNIVFKLLWEAGLIAVIGYIIILTITVRHAWTLIRYSRGTDFHLTAVALLASFVAANTSAQMNPVITERWYWLPTAFIGVAWTLRYSKLPTSGRGPTQLAVAK